MARARNIKPGFFTNEDLVELDFATRLLFIGLWTEADRAGRLEDRPKRLKMAIFPADSVDVDAMLEGLERFGFIRRYVACGRRLIQVVNWSKHQSPHHTEKASELPPEGATIKPEAAAVDNGDVTVDSPKQNGELAANLPQITPGPAAKQAGETPAVAQQGDVPFLMRLEWEPDQNKLKTLALCAGLPLEAFSREAVGGFKVHHEAGAVAKTDKQWLAALVNWVKRDYVRDARVVRFPAPRQVNGPDFDDMTWAEDLGDL